MERFDVKQLESFAESLFEKAGMEADKAASVARLLVHTDAHGVPTRDPAVLEHTAPRGSLQLMGGAEYGHKGFGLSLMVEALSQGLSGHGRKDAPKRWGGSTFVQVISPESFSGADVFAEQMDYLSDRCRSNKPINPAQPVRMPGDQAARGIAAAQQDGIAFDADTWAALSQWAGKLGVALP